MTKQSFSKGQLTFVPATSEIVVTDQLLEKTFSSEWSTAQGLAHADLCELVILRIASYFTWGSTL